MKVSIMVIFKIHLFKENLSILKFMLKKFTHHQSRKLHKIEVPIVHLQGLMIMMKKMKMKIIIAKIITLKIIPMKASAVVISQASSLILKASSKVLRITCISINSLLKDNSSMSNPKFSHLTNPTTSTTFITNWMKSILLPSVSNRAT
jgi:hypothetical protein